MIPDVPLRWIGTVTRKRDEGLYHLEATGKRLIHPAPGTPPDAPVETAPVVVPACGAQPFSFSGSFPDGGDWPSPSRRCQRCEAMAAAIRRD